MEIINIMDVKFKEIEFVYGDRDGGCKKCIFQNEGAYPCHESDGIIEVLTGINCTDPIIGYFRFQEKWEPLTRNNIRVGAKVRSQGVKEGEVVYVPSKTVDFFVIKNIKTGMELVVDYYEFEIKVDRD